MPDAKISVIVATRNRPLLIRRAVDSLLKQTYQDFEIIIIDDASGEEAQKSLSVIKEWDSRIKVIRNDKNLGPGIARNEGINNARGEYIAIMDDDDVSLPDRLLKQKNILDNNQQLGLVFSSVGWLDEKGEVYEIFPGIAHRGEFPVEPKQVFELLYLEGNKINNTTVMIRKRIIQTVAYPENPWIGEDWLLFMRLAALGIRMMAIPEPLVLMRRDSKTVGLMSDKGSAFNAQRQVLSIIRSWLKEEGIHDFDNLHRLAFSNQLVNEARFWWGFKGLGLTLKAIIVTPQNAKAWSTLGWLIGKCPKKIRLLFTIRDK